MSAASAGVRSSVALDGERAARAWLAGAGGAWALLSAPIVVAAWGGPLASIGRLEPWRSAGAAVDDPYVVFGALSGASFLAIGLALLPDLRRAGWGGALLAWSIVLGAPITAISYLSTPVDAPLHALWGAEGPWLVGIGLLGVAAAVTAGRSWPRWTRALLGLTLPVLVLGLLALGYYPHGCLVTLAIEAVALILAAPRGPRSPATAS